MRPSVYIPMSTYVLIHGAGSDAWYWHLVAPQLEARGHDVVAVDLPCDDDTAGFEQYADVVVKAAASHDDIVLVAQSLGGFTAPLVCERLDVELLVLVAAMVPRPGEPAGEWWANTGHVFPEPFDPEVVFLHDVPADVAAASIAHVRDQSGAPFAAPWPLEQWPDVPTRFLLCRDDRFFPADFQRRVVRERLGFEPDEMRGGHLPALAHPNELVERLESYRLSV
ncbi:MAG TPA: alpha/beta hydrolase [Acidimicrobiales bacterium]|nr:alpha/beta hydrolase [Acidimicrobiales bacterium]